MQHHGPAIGHRPVIPNCNSTSGFCAVCNPSDGGLLDQRQTVNIHCEDVGCVHSDTCNADMYHYCGGARNESAASCVECVVKNRNKFNSDDCFKTDDEDFCLATPPYCTPF